MRYTTVLVLMSAPLSDILFNIGKGNQDHESYCLLYCGRLTDLTTGLLAIVVVWKLKGPADTLSL